MISLSRYSLSCRHYPCIAISRPPPGSKDKRLYGRAGTSANYRPVGVVGPQNFISYLTTLTTLVSTCPSGLHHVQTLQAVTHGRDPASSEAALRQTGRPKGLTGPRPTGTNVFFFKKKTKKNNQRRKTPRTTPAKPRAPHPRPDRAPDATGGPTIKTGYRRQTGGGPEGDPPGGRRCGPCP